VHVQEQIRKFDIPRRPQYSDLSGRRFGKLIVNSFSYQNDRQQAYWLCNCDCGDTKIVKAAALNSGDTKSCGCLHKKRCGDISGHYFLNLFNHAKKRGIPFNITILDMWQKFIKQKGLCPLSNIELHLDPHIKKNNTASLDRIDSSLPYTVDNIQWVHKVVNRMKWDMPEVEFFKWIEILHKAKTKGA
jgi:hypothetical protein